MKSILSFVAVMALAGCSLLHSPPASASTITVEWDPITVNTDGSPVPDTGPESIASIRIEFGTCVSGAFGVKGGEFIRTRVAGQPAPTSAVNNVPPGMTCVRAYAKNVAGNEGPTSNVASTVVAPSTPSAPNIRRVASG